MGAIGMSGADRTSNGGRADDFPAVALLAQDLPHVGYQMDNRSHLFTSEICFCPSHHVICAALGFCIDLHGQTSLAARSSQWTPAAFCCSAPGSLIHK